MIIAKKYSLNPIITPTLNSNQLHKEVSVYNPTAIVKDERVFLFYRSEIGCGRKNISRINLAVSKNGFVFKIFSKNPIIQPECKNERKGCEDPRITKISENEYLLTYTAYAGRSRKGEFKVNIYGATSNDLLRWKKIKCLINNDKSGIPIGNYKYKDKYVMFFGGETIKIAFSKNFKNWEIIKKPILAPRKGNFFDNYWTEGGPSPILTKKGIFLIYNSRNNKGKFSTGIAIFDKNNPTKLIFRSKKPILEPTEYWEKYGKANNVVFSTGLIYFRNKWLLYYGGADKSIGVAIMKNLSF